MNGSSLPPPHPSLPRPPQSSAASSYQYQPQAYYNSHYVQAYAQAQPQTPASFSAPVNFTTATRTPSAPQGAWYQPGNNRCSHPGCAFTGSHKTVEIHMMDRHLIYPPGWDKQKKKSDWDADPSLKGKPIPIQGTNVILDSPEVLEAWIAERKRRFPTSARVEEKKRKMEEAIARGQLDIGDSSGRPNKRRNVDHGNSSNSNHIGNRNHQSNRNNRTTNQRGEHPRPATEQRVPDSGWPRKAQTKEPAPVPVPVAIRPSVVSDSDSDSDGDDEDDQPEAISSKAIPFTEQAPSIDTCIPADEGPKTSPPKVAPIDKAPRKKGLLQPKLPPKNPFASRPTLLRNLLLPEIRVTISNLSQAIRFLVDNDFLQDVELKPGQAEEEKHKIQVISNESNSNSTN